MHDGALDHAIEPKSGLGLDRFASGHRGEGAIEHFLQIAPEGVEVHAASRQDVFRLRVFDQRVQHMLEADEVVATVRRDAKGAADTLKRVWCERHRGAAHFPRSSESGSMVTSSGYS